MLNRLARTVTTPMLVSIAALALAVGTGSAVALPGNNKVKSGDIAEGAVKSSDINDGAVKAQDLDELVSAARAGASLNGSGVLLANFAPFGLAQANISKPGGTTGLYCFAGLTFTPRGAAATDSTGGGLNDVVAVVPGQALSCPAGTQLTVRITDPAGANNPVDSGFNILVF
jgi:hypothetical protein